MDRPTANFDYQRRRPISQHKMRRISSTAILLVSSGYFLLSCLESAPPVATAWSVSPQPRHRNSQTKENVRKWVASSCIAAGLLVVSTSSVCWADEIGRERDAPTIFTGETVEICTKRGILGACRETTVRTNENDNDISQSYFKKNPIAAIGGARSANSADNTDDSSNALIQKLRQQSEDNREKNDLFVQQKTFEADQSAAFGPFDRQVLILNTDGRTFTVLENPVAMRLKKAGFIEGRKFIKQPGAEDIAKAEEKPPGLFQGIFGVFSGSNDDGASENSPTTSSATASIIGTAVEESVNLPSATLEEPVAAAAATTTTTTLLEQNGGDVVDQPAIVTEEASAAS